MDEKVLKALRKFRKQLVITKYTLARGYVWLQVPTLGIIGAGVIKPYFPMLRFYQLVLIAIVVFYIVGLFDRWLKLVHEENSMITELNPTLMRGLYGDKNGRKK